MQIYYTNDSLSANMHMETRKAQLCRSGNKPNARESSCLHQPRPRSWETRQWMGWLHPKGWQTGDPGRATVPFSAQSLPSKDSLYSGFSGLDRASHNREAASLLCQGKLYSPSQKHPDKVLKIMLDQVSGHSVAWSSCHIYWPTTVDALWTPPRS